MKKVILLFIATFGLCCSALSQMSYRGHLGINATQINLETLQGQLSGASGLSIGIDVQLGNRFYLQPGINYSAKNFKLDGLGNINVNKLNLPVLVGIRAVKPLDNSTNNMRLFFGPNFSTTLNETISELVNEFSKEDIQNFNVGIIAGIGFDLHMLFVDISYKYGVNDFINNNGKSTPLNGFLVNLGVRF